MHIPGAGTASPLYWPLTVFVLTIFSGTNRNTPYRVPAQPAPAIGRFPATSNPLDVRQIQGACWGQLPDGVRQGLFRTVCSIRCMCRSRYSEASSCNLPRATIFSPRIATAPLAQKEANWSSSFLHGSCSWTSGWHDGVDTSRRIPAGSWLVGFLRPSLLPE